jgi:hypothetical protein
MLNILRPLVRSALQCAGALSVSVLSLASAQDIRIAHVYDKTGPSRPTPSRRRSA